MLTNKRTRRLLPLSACLPVLLLFSCNERKNERVVEPAFYYWKSVFQLNNFEKQRLDSLEVKTIYLKFFDVEWDISTSKALPVAKLVVNDTAALHTYQIIPTAFITNASLEKLDTSQVMQLADNIYHLMRRTWELNLLQAPGEIQLDCDWTATTRDRYFLLLRSFKQLSGIAISATIRLHQVKFLAKTGVPPVDRGLLMCYNMGNLKNPATNNSIIETAELKKYIGNLSTYPLPLDVALPLFGWKVLFRNNVYHGLIQDIPASMFTASFAQVNKAHIKILSDTVLAGYELKKGDDLRMEESPPGEIASTAKAVSDRLQNTRLRVSLYHLDSVTLNKFTTHELEGIYRIFR